MSLSEFNVDMEEQTEIENRLRIYGCRGDIYEALCDVNKELEERNIDLRFVNVMPGCSDYGIVPVTLEEMKVLAVNSDMLRPAWDNIEGKGDWKYHVPESVREIWNTFDTDQILALHNSYVEQADEATQVIDLLASD